MYQVAVIAGDDEILLSSESYELAMVTVRAAAADGLATIVTGPDGAIVAAYDVDGIAWL
jgi:hypothetical protein